MREKTMSGEITTQNGQQIRQVGGRLDWRDYLGNWKVRWGVGRMKHKVEPGLYALGEPCEDSPVFVSANYKLSFDCLRSNLTGRDGWILVLDTKGVNVWCAAGKGTFGTGELVSRIEEVKLGEVVNHRKLIVPQLGATGVSAHEVKEQSGFRVVYGPVCASDLPAFIDADMKATAEMRRVRFGLVARTLLIPMEIAMWAKAALIAAVCLFLLAGLNRSGYSIPLVMSDGLCSAALLLVGFLAGAILGPLLLPYLPGRAFSLKGFWIGLAMSIGGAAEALFAKSGVGCAAAVINTMFHRKNTLCNCDGDDSSVYENC